MPYLIDGHNLIPKLGLDLNAIEDEMALVEKLNQFCRISRRNQVEVFFDNARPGGSEKQKMGMVSVLFVRRPMIADEAIRLRLKKLKNDARNWIVVSSDRRVQAEARAAGAKPINSEEFADEVIDALRSGPTREDKTSTSASEISEWLSLFGENDDDPKKL